MRTSQTIFVVHSVRHRLSQQSPVKVYFLQKFLQNIFVNQKSYITTFITCFSTKQYPFTISTCLIKFQGLLCTENPILIRDVNIFYIHILITVLKKTTLNITRICMDFFNIETNQMLKYTHYTFQQSVLETRQKYHQQIFIFMLNYLSVCCCFSLSPNFFCEVA